MGSMNLARGIMGYVSKIRSGAACVAVGQRKREFE